MIVSLSKPPNDHGLHLGKLGMGNLWFNSQTSVTKIIYINYMEGMGKGKSKVGSETK